MTTAVLLQEKKTLLLLLPPARPMAPVIALPTKSERKPDPDPRSFKMPPQPQGCFKGKDNDCL